MAFPVHFVDVETSHLDPDIGEILSIAIITEDEDLGLTTQYATLIKPVQLHRADPKSLEINGYSPANGQVPRLLKTLQAWYTKSLDMA